MNYLFYPWAVIDRINIIQRFNKTYLTSSVFTTKCLPEFDLLPSSFVKMCESRPYLLKSVK